MMQKENGFTLVELAIALMVIGLLIGGVLKGQELIDNARITATIRQIKAYDAATMIFRNTYNALPGDIKRPNRIPNCTEDICAIPGDGNGKVGMLGPAEEVHNFFPHLTKAGMIQGPEGGTPEEMNASNGDPETGIENEKFFPQMPIDLAYRMEMRYLNPGANRPGKHAYYVVSAVKYVAAIDAKMDDGKPFQLDGGASGDVWLDGADSCEDSSDITMYNMSVTWACPIWVRTEF